MSLPVQTFFLEYTGKGRICKDGQRISIGTYDEWKALADECKADSWEPTYIRTDTGEEMIWQEAPIGATTLIDKDYCSGPDGKSFIVKCIGGSTWRVDSRCDNCDKISDNEHRCWIRHGDPRQCRVHVDKDGLTCGAGGGSIQTCNWHGFLTNGVLQDQR